MSRTITVPASVPSLFHNSRPLTGSDAAKNSVPPTLVSPCGADSTIPGQMSLTSTVPAGVPSLFQSDGSPSAPGAPKKTVLPTTAIGYCDPTDSGLFLSRTVPATVPSVRHSCVMPPLSGAIPSAKAIPPARAM